MIRQHVILFFAWVAWCALHSGLVSVQSAGYVERRFPGLSRFYRVLFNAASLATLVPLMLYTAAAGGATVFRWPGWLQGARWALLGGSLLLFLAGARRYDMLRFLGVRQLAADVGRGGLTAAGGIDRRGILGLVRHPWYLAGMMLVWARDLTLPDLVVNMVVTCYFVLGAYWEERKLVREFGQAYVYYQQEVSMLVPSKWLWRAARRAASSRFRARRGETCGHDEPEENDHL